MLWNSVALILLINYCTCFNISELLASREKPIQLSQEEAEAAELPTSHEKVTRLLQEEAKESKSTGYNLAKIKVANEVIIQLMDKGLKKVHGEEVLKLICEYTVGMNENSLDIVTMRDFRTMRKVYDDIYSFGKPPFIEHKCDMEGMQLRFQWDDGPIRYFNYIRNDALTAWNYFVEQYKIITDKLKMVSPSYYA